MADVMIVGDDTCRELHQLRLILVSSGFSVPY